MKINIPRGGQSSASDISHLPLTELAWGRRPSLGFSLWASGRKSAAARVSAWWTAAGGSRTPETPGWTGVRSGSGCPPSAPAWPDAAWPAVASAQAAAGSKSVWAGRPREFGLRGSSPLGFSPAGFSQRSSWNLRSGRCALWCHCRRSPFCARRCFLCLPPQHGFHPLHPPSPLDPASSQSPPTVRRALLPPATAVFRWRPAAERPKWHFWTWPSLERLCSRWPDLQLRPHHCPLWSCRPSDLPHAPWPRSRSFSPTPLHRPAAPRFLPFCPAAGGAQTDAGGGATPPGRSYGRCKWRILRVSGRPSAAWTSGTACGQGGRPVWWETPRSSGAPAPSSHRQSS